MLLSCLRVVAGYLETRVSVEVAEGCCGLAVERGELFDAVVDLLPALSRDIRPGRRIGVGVQPGLEVGDFPVLVAIPKPGLGITVVAQREVAVDGSAPVAGVFGGAGGGVGLLLRLTTGMIWWA